MSIFNFLNEEKLLITELEQKNFYILSDTHFYRNAVYNKEVSQKDIRDFIAKYNNRIKDNDIVLFLGDISTRHIVKPEFSYIKDKLKEIFSKLRGKKILIRGNHDIVLEDSFYIKVLGFEFVTNKLLLPNKKILLTHVPSDVSKTDLFNIHGHIHGSKFYYGMKSDNHIDAFIGLWGKPIKEIELIEKYYCGSYKGISVLNKPSDESMMFDKDYNWIKDSVMNN